VRKVGPVLVSLLVILILPGCGNPGFGGHPDARAYLVAQVPPTLPTPPASYLGAYEAATPMSYASLRRFGTAVGRRPDLALYFSVWGKQFMAPFIRKVSRHGAIPLVQMDPPAGSLGAIASGRDDAYLRSYARQVRSYGHGVIIGFAHDMNNARYSWGWRHVRAAVWVAAWRHVVEVFHDERALNVTWLWTISSPGTRVAPPRRWWPGSRYVTWIGIDGDYSATHSDFTNIFGSTITSIRGFAGKPILLSEVRMGTASDVASQISTLLSGVRNRRLLGFVWVDAAIPSRRLEENAAALAEFRQRVALVMRARG
jgi:mannan endo-1,4-beta-mannosidase